MRDMVLAQLQREGFFTHVSDALELGEEDYSNAIRVMEKRVCQNFQIDMTAYLQTHPTSCGSACVIMLLQQYFGINGSQDLEMEIFSQVGYPRNYTG